MAISGFGRAKGEEGMATPAPPSNPGALTAFIDQGSEFEGKLTFKDTVRIDGRFQGEISSENTLIVGKSGEIEASIRSTNVVINGTVVGNIEARGQLTLHKTARVDGDVNTPVLVVEEGAVFNGRLTMGKTGGQQKGPASFIPIKGGGKDKEQEKGDQNGGGGGGG